MSFQLHEMFDACHILFGPEVEVNEQFLQYLQISGLKSAYRKKVFETHPDRALILGKDRAAMNELFKKVAMAYRKLNFMVRTNEKAASCLQKKCHEGAIKKSSFSCLSESFYAGAVPQRKLLIGQFLYYSGVISWSSLIKALTWQRMQRPLIGQIAQKWGMLSSLDIQEIIENKNFNDKFGEYAVQNGYITYINLLALLGKQRMLQRRLGEYFVENNIMRADDIDEMVQKMNLHNRCVLLKKVRL